MFDINDIKPEDTQKESRALKNLRYLLFTFKTEAEMDSKRLKGEDIPPYERPDVAFTEDQVSDIKAQIESMDYFDGWIRFGDTWDIVWIGLFIETNSEGAPIDASWRPGFHGAERRIVSPIRLTRINSVKRMEVTFEDTKVIMETPVPKELRDAILHNKEKQLEMLERQMIGQSLPGGDTFAKNTIKQEKLRKAIEKQKEINDRLKEIAREEREANGEEDND